MTKPQLSFYRVLWNQAKKVLRARGFTPSEAEAMRHTLHSEALGYDKSSLDLNNAEFDKVKAAFLAITSPTDLDAQIEQRQMPLTRMRIALRYFVAALDQSEDYVISIARRMDRERRMAGRHLTAAQREEAGLTIEDLDKVALQKLTIAVKVQCKRRWPTKDELLNAFMVWCEDCVADQAWAAVVVCKALCVASVPRWDKLQYEDLLIAWGALKAGLAPTPETITHTLGGAGKPRSTEGPIPLEPPQLSLL